jgi:phosphoglycerol transferase MdoB-like AlkP superfamily enzyme
VFKKLLDITSMKLQLKSNLGVVAVRLLLVYIAYMLCRLAFYSYNNELIDPLGNTPLWSLARGSFMFDTVSIIYTNLLFIALSLLPLRRAENRYWQKATFWAFIVPNALGLAINVTDIFYFPFKQARIVLSDFMLLSEMNGGIFTDFIADFWYGFLFYFVLLGFLWLGYKAIKLKEKEPEKQTKLCFYTVGWASLSVMAVAIVFFVRGATFSASSYPINMNDAFLYTANPTHTSVILSNPFCLLRTMGRTQKIPKVHYFDDNTAHNMAPTTHTATDWDAYDIDRKTNVVVIILESFGKAHIKGLSDQFKPGQESNTPFIDSLIGQSYTFTNAFQNGRRSVDALPAIWAGIPSFKDHFLSLPNAVAPYHALPACMEEMGYNTAFFHGGVHETMGFVAFGKTAGIDNFYMREEYEAERGTNDFDGKWGIWDHKFMPFVHNKLNMMYKQGKPFFATYFSLSSHHPYAIPEGMEHMFTEGTMPIHRAIKYSDYALKQFFNSIKNEPWYNNTLFIITADHNSGADSKKFNKQPYEYSIPIMFFKPGSRFVGKDDRVIQHIDVMPTLLGMLDYSEPYFSFGTDHFDKAAAKEHFVLNYAHGVYNCSTDKYCYFFNEKEVIAKFDYHKDPLCKHKLPFTSPDDQETINRLKAFLQEYAWHLNKRDYLPEGGKPHLAVLDNKRPRQAR